jgi:large subunit ribosomal protein L10
MPKTRLQKQESVLAITQKLEKAKAVVFADYKGLKMSQLSDLRKKLREQNAEFSITKNTLLEHALPSSKFQLPTPSLVGPTATLFAYDDQITPIKILVKAFKDYSMGKVKSGFLDSEVLDEEKIIQLSTLPSKDELRAALLGVLSSPLRGIASVLQVNLRNLVYALSQIQIRHPSTDGGG